jgi:hypothetical protein
VPSPNPSASSTPTIPNPAPGLRGLDTHEKAAVNAVKSIMGISGGRRKIKSKELLDMKKGVNIQRGSRRKIKSKELLDMKKGDNIQKGSRRKIKSKELLDMKKGVNIQKGGQGVQGPPTNPTDRTYTSVKTDQEVLDAIRFCEAGHYDPALTTQFPTSRFPNTDSYYDIVQLRECIGKELFQTDYTDKKAAEKAPTLPALLSLFPTTTSFGHCTTAKNTRGQCPPGKRAISARSLSSAGTSRGMGQALWTGGSRKKNPRSKAKRNTVKKSKY